MPTRRIVIMLAGALLGAGLAGALWAEDAPGATTPARTNRTVRRTGQSVLPDPSLFDGSAFPAEKRPDRGMLGQFEMEGKENAQDQQKVGGSSNPGSEQQGMPTPGGSGGAKEDAKQPAAAQAAAGGDKQESGEGGGGDKPLDKNDPNAKAEGIKAGELRIGEGQDPNAQGQNNPDHPKEVQIGDATMKIPTTTPPGQQVVGAQAVQGPTQQFETQVGKGVYQGGDNTNKGVEKGRAMPPGI
jgi:hypothetical protein